MIKVTSLCYLIVSAASDIHEFCNAEQLLNSPIDFDIIFLDIEMPDKSGLDLLFENPKHFQYSKIVLLTSHSEFSTVGYEVNAFNNFLLR